MATSIAARHGPKIAKLGRKQIFLPNFTLTLLRTPDLPPTFASFIVPLYLNKLDLRDYLWNAYGIPALSVRSYIQQQKIRHDKPGARRPRPARWFRPRSIKKMTVEMERPFVWPHEPTNLEQWDKLTYDAAAKEQKENEAPFRPGWREKPTREREPIAEQARALLAAKAKSVPPTSSQWEDVGSPVEVETDVTVPVSEK